MSFTHAPFKTHLNYVKCLEKILKDCEIDVKAIPNRVIRKKDIERFTKLDAITYKSIAFDISLVKLDNEFAIICAPWFGVKCYYSLYYLESILVNLINGSPAGFLIGGHTKIRNNISRLLSSGNIIFSKAELNAVIPFQNISKYPRIVSGKNTKNNFWNDPECLYSLVKKLMEYVLYNQKMTKKWDLHRTHDRIERKEFILNAGLNLTDFFYWYRIKANYRDLDYIDFENGLDEHEVLDYMRSYYLAYSYYRKLLINGIRQAS